MQIKLFTGALVLLGAVSLYAQDSESHMPVTLGLKFGVPITQMYSAGNTTQFGNSLPNSPFSSHTPRYILGASGEFHLPGQWRFEVDGLYKRGGFNSALPFGGTSQLAYRPTSMNVWEVPGLFKHNFSMGHFRPFFDIGASLRHVSTITETTFAPGVAIATTSNNSIAMHNRNSFGGVAGIGMTFKKGAFELSPEVRYTRWANESFQYPGLRTNLDQGDFLLGISF